MLMHWDPQVFVHFLLDLSLSLLEVQEALKAIPVRSVEQHRYQIQEFQSLTWCSCRQYFCFLKYFSLLQDFQRIISCSRNQANSRHQCLVHRPLMTVFHLHGLSAQYDLDLNLRREALQSSMFHESQEKLPVNPVDELVILRLISP